MRTQLNTARLAIWGCSLALGATFAASGATAQGTVPCPDCAQLGRVAAQLQLKALEAEELVKRVPSMLAEADALDREARSHSDASDAALNRAEGPGSYHKLAESATDLANRTGRQEDFDQATAYRQEEKKALDEMRSEGELAKAARTKAQELRDKANSAKADAEKAAQEAAKAWQAYYDCLKKAKCPDPQATGKTPTGFSNCPEAQEWLDRANELQKMADRERGLAQQAAASGDQKSAATLEDQAKMSESMARQRERLAAYALEKCKDKGNTVGQPGGGPGKDTTVNATPQQGSATTGTAIPPGAIPLPRESQVTTTIAITNNCKTAESFRIEVTGFPEGMVEVPEVPRVDTESSRDFPVTYSAKGAKPGLYSGKITVICVTCDASCPQKERVFHVQLFVPAQ